MHDPQYRCAIAWQNTGYNQPPHPGFYIGPQMYPPPISPMSDANLVWGGAASSNWDEGATSDWFTNRVWMSNYTASVFHSGNSVLFDIGGSNNFADQPRRRAGSGQCHGVRAAGFYFQRCRFIDRLDVVDQSRRRQIDDRQHEHFHRSHCGHGRNAAGQRQS